MSYSLKNKKNGQTGVIRSNFFNDGKTIIDYVFVLPHNIKKRRVHLKYVKKFINDLQDKGLKFELFRSTIDNDIFVKVNLPSHALYHYAQIYNIDISHAGHFYIPIQGFTCKKFETPLTDDQQDVFKRKKGATSMERILIADHLFNDIQFAAREEMCGLNKLLHLGVIKAAFPLHDGDYHYGEEKDSELNDRQLLLKYWANFSMWYKKQPLNLVEKYYGTEIAFYFAWLGFYNQMLIPAAIVGVICFLGSVIMLLSQSNPIIEETCESQMPICQRCMSNTSCLINTLQATCQYAKLSFLFDNGVTVFFAFFMSFWASLFLSLWKRMENVLKIRWNVKIVEKNTRIRMDYKIKATATRVSPISGELEPCVPLKKRILYTTITYLACLTLLLVVILAVIGIMLFSIGMSEDLKQGEVILYDYVMLLVLICGSTLQVIFIKLFGRLYGPISIFLTNIENPRTQEEFDKSVLHKRYFLGFVNNYVPLFYIAFFKGRLYSPKDALAGHVNILSHDVCHPQGCLVPLCIQLSFYMFLKSLAGNIITLIKPKIIRWFTKKKAPVENISQSEIENDLETSDEYLLTTEFMEMIIQYGFVTFFVAAFPLAPLCALINNTMELRLDAYKFVTRHRRPVPKKQAGIGTWNDILRSITYLSTATNAFVLAFTSDFVSRMIYMNSNKSRSLNGYLNYTLSVFEIQGENISYCYYRALRYPPDDPKQYSLTSAYFYEIGVKFAVVLIFEKLVVIFRGLLLYNIRDVPTVVKQKINDEMNVERELKIKMFAEKYHSVLDHGTRSSVVIQRRDTKKSVKSINV